MTKREIIKRLQVMVNQRIKHLDKGYGDDAPRPVQVERQELSVIEDWLAQEVNGLNTEEYPHEQWAQLRS